MEKWIGSLLVDAWPPEKPKFKSPLILVHGLWSSSRCWRPWGAHFSNLGWDCWAVNFRGRFEERALEALKRLRFQDCLDDLRQAIRAAPFPPVLLAHDLGGLMAQKAAEEEKVSALILLSSLPPREVMASLPRDLRLLRLKYAPLLFLRRPFPIEAEDFRKHWLASLPLGSHAEPLRCLVPDSGYLAAEFFDRRVRINPKSVHCPVLVVGGSDDRVVSAASLRDLARWLGAGLREYPGHGHWMMGEQSGAEIVRDIHRWIVKQLGEEILLGEEPTLGQEL